MALATRCPQCQTAFRVASDQLKLRAGLVRCGTCKEIFNGIENLLHPDEDISAAIAASAPTTTTLLEEVAPEARQLPASPNADVDQVSNANIEVEDHKADRDHDDTSGRSTDPMDKSDESGSTDKLTSESLWLALADDAPNSSSSASPLPAPQSSLLPGATAESQSTSPPSSLPNAAPASSPNAMPGPPTGLLRAASIDSQTSDVPIPTSNPGAKTTFKRSAKPGLKPAQTAFRKPIRKGASEKTAAAVPVEEPDFIQREEIEQGKQRITRPLFLALCSVLAIALVLQLTYAMRTSLAAHFPQSRPLLEKACGALGCSVGLPMQIESVSIESSDLQPIENTPGKFVLNVLLRNRDKTVQAWPAIELSLQDTGDKTVGRRVIVASEFLPAGSTTANGFAANSEQAIKINLDLTQLKASGYRVYLFYP